MNEEANFKITSVIILISFMLIAVTTFSVISDQINDTTTNETDDDLIEILEKTTDESVDEITTYFKIMDKVGKYEGENHKQKITKIAIMIKPLITKQINISELTVKIYNDEDIQMLNYCNETKKITPKHNQIFSHPLWNNITYYNFGLISTHDTDDSLSKHNIFNKNTDMAYLIIKLPSSFQMEKNDEITVQLFPSTGIKKTMNLHAPLPMKKVISF
ncbi:MAG: hypothetical protein V5A64_01525 [Candidatus Thermoplasmatota archaeon]